MHEKLALSLKWYKKGIAKLKWSLKLDIEIWKLMMLEILLRLVDTIYCTTRYF